MTGSRVWVGVVIASLLLVGTAAQAQEDDGGAVLLILDASGSMNGIDDNGVRLIDGAQNALERLVSSLPEGTPVGLRVYGHRVPNTDKANGCRDSELIVPVGPLERTTMVDAIRSFSAKGFTPIGLSLEEAASDLPDGHGTVILVSDGEDTCAPPDPCEIAAGLVDSGIDVRVHTVGFFLQENDAARTQLQCIAEATNASYRDVDAIEPLAAELGAIIRESNPSVGRIHLPLEGSYVRQDAPSAPLFAAQGVGLGGLEGSFDGTLEPNRTLWYTVEIGEPSWAFAWADPSPFAEGAQPGDTFHIVITDIEGTPIHLWDSRSGSATVDLHDFASGAPFSAGAGVHVGFDVLWAQLEPELQASLTHMGYDAAANDAVVRELLTRPQPPHVGPGTYYVGITWTSVSDRAPRSVPWGFSTWAIDPADSTHLRYEPISGASDQTDAPGLSPGEYVRGPLLPGPEDAGRQAGYVAPISRGQTLYFTTHLEWDEALSVRAFLNRDAGFTVGSVEDFRVEIFDPDTKTITAPIHDWRPTVDMTDEAALDSSFLLPGMSPRPFVGAGTPWLADGATPTTEGTHLIAFTWTGDADGAAAEVEFVVNVHGDLGIPGPAMRAPDNDGVDVDIEAFAEPPDEAPDEPADDDSPPILFIGLGMLGVAAIALVAVRRRRR